MSPRPMLRGWMLPGNSPQAHYFVGATSLCGAVEIANPRAPRIDSRIISKEDCRDCAAKLLKKREKARVR